MKAIFSEQCFLIIGGTSKSGTTSVYNYLSQHPQICPSLIKETRFFLDADYPLPRRTVFNQELTGYADFFSGWEKPNRVLMEATPDYLYSKTALQIATLLPQAKIIFILRDPIERLVSWYKYAKQRAMLSASFSFEDYVQVQLEKKTDSKTPVCLRALEQGRYGKYIESFQKNFKERLLILQFDELRLDPKDFMRKVCLFSGLDFSYYERYEFRAHNKSKKIFLPKLSAAVGFWAVFLRFRLMKHKRVRHFFLTLKASLESFFSFAEIKEDVVVSQPVKSGLLKYYES